MFETKYKNIIIIIVQYKIILYKFKDQICYGFYLFLVFLEKKLCIEGMQIHTACACL
jgi:hypothetical protein